MFLILISCGTTTKIVKETKQQTQPYENIEGGNLENNENKLTVAILLPLSGKAEKIGNSMLKSAQLAMFDSKLDNIILKPYDTKGTASGATEAINSVIKDNADIVIGPLFTQTTKAIIDIAAINNLMILSFSDNQSLLDENHNNVYLMGFTQKQEIERIISYLVSNKNYYGFSAMFPSDIYGSSASKTFKDVVFRKDSKIVKIDFYSKNDSNLESKINSLLEMNTYRDEVYKKYKEDKALAKAQGLGNDVEFKYTDDDKIYADALLIPDSGNELNNIADILAKYSGTHKPLLVGTSKWLNNPLYNNANFNGTLFVASNPNDYSSFENNYYSTFNSYPLRVSSLAYDAVKAVMEAYSQAGEKNNLKYAIENYQGFEGANGKYRFLSNGFVERKLSIIKILDGKYEIIDYDNNEFLKY